MAAVLRPHYEKPIESYLGRWKIQCRGLWRFL